MSSKKTKKLFAIMMLGILMVTIGIIQVAAMNTTRVNGAVNDTFTSNGLEYLVTSINPAEVAVNTYVEVGAPNTIIPHEVVNGSNTYSVTSIGGGAFENTALKSIVIPHSVTSIGNGAFNECTELTNVTIKNEAGAESQLETIEEFAFHRSALTSIIIPQSVTSIGKRAFRACRVLTNVTIKNEAGAESQLATIEEFAFQESALTSIEIPQGVTSIEDGAFSECPALTDVTIKNEEGDVSKLERIGFHAFYKSEIESIVIPQSVTSIGNGAFQECPALTDVTIKNEAGAESQLVTIEGIAFFQSALTSIEIPQSVTSIGELAFYACTALTDVTIKNEVDAESQLEAIGEWVFAQSGIVSIVIPQSVMSIAEYAFWDCKALASVEITKTADKASKLETIGECAFFESGITSIAIPQSVKSIGLSSFSECTALTSVTIENTDDKLSTLGIIGQQAFYKSGITSIVIPQSVITIDKYAFTLCESLNNVEITNTAATPSNLETIGQQAFQKTAIESIVIPQKVTTIESYAFNACANLSVIVFKGVTVPTFEENLFAGAGKNIKAYVPSAQKTGYEGAIKAEAVLKDYTNTLTVLGYGELALTENSLAVAEIEEAGYAQTITATGGIEGEVVEYTITDGALPLGLSMDVSGKVTGTATKLAKFTFTVTAKVANAEAKLAYSSVKEYEINVTDTTPPTITVEKETVEIELGGNITEKDFLDQVKVNTVDLGGAVTITTNFATVNQNAIGTAAVTITATDASNNASTKTITFNVTDKTAPTITVEKGTVEIELGGNITEKDFLDQVKVNTADLGGAVTITTDFMTVVKQNAIGTAAVTITATDASKNASTKTITVNVTDKTAPTITVEKGTVEIELGGNITEADFLKLVVVTTADLGGAVTITTDFMTVKQNAVGTTTVTITATDASNNASTKTITFSVTDTTPPTITVDKETVEIELGGNITEAEFLKLIGVRTDDNAGVTTRINSTGVVITTDFDTVNQNAVGTTTVTITATDASGNFSTKTVTVNVADTTPTTEPTTEEPTTIKEETTTGAGTDVETGDNLVTPLFFTIALFSIVVIASTRKRKEEHQG